MPGVSKGKALLLAPLACLCLSAGSTQKDRLIVIGPLLEGEDLEVQFTFYKPKYGTDYVAYFDAFGDGLPSSPKGIKQTSLRNLRANGDGFATFEASIAGRYLKAGQPISVELGLCETMYYRGIDWSKKRFSCNESYQIKKGQKLYRTAEEGVFETQNEIYHADETKPQEVGIDHDAYEAKNLIRGINFMNRKVPLEKVRLSYYGYGAKPKSLTKAELRLLDHLEDFEDVATKVGAYATLPLKASILDKGDGNYVYSFSLAESYYYSRIDLRAFRNKPPLTEPSFESSALFFPLREGHDNVTHHFQIVLENAGAFSDQVILDNSLSSARSYFGNCLWSEYCVVGGGR